MRLYEYEAKKLFEQFGIPIPQGILCASIADVETAADTIGFPLVLKSQVLTGGRGKAGGIKVVSNSEDLSLQTKNLFSLKIKGFAVKSILVEKALNISKEFYLGITINRADYKIAIIASECGGIDIEKVAEESPDKIHKIELDIDDKFFSFHAIGLAKKLGFASDKIRDFSIIALALFKFFKSYDAKLAEINPLVLTADGRLIAADGRVSLDDDALFRHPDLAKMGIEKRHEEGELTPRELKARESNFSTF